MNKISKLLILSTSGLILSHISYPINAEASGGSYQGSSSRSSSSSRAPSSSRAKSPRKIINYGKVKTAPQNADLDQNRYNLGKRVLQGDSPLSSYSDTVAADQKESLARIADRLPASAKRKLNIDSIAGKLSSDQLEAVKYYLTQRYLR